MYSGFPDNASSYVDFWLATGKAQSLWLVGATRNATPGVVINEKQYNWGARELQFRNAARDPPLEYDYWANELLVSPAAFYAPLFYAQATDGIVYAGLGATLARFAAKAFDYKGIDLSAGEYETNWRSDAARQKFLHPRQVSAARLRGHHGPPGGRLCNQLLVNERRFSSAFNCSLGEQPMAPVSTCKH
ncbi:hypothetical protein MTO96_030762 [Rhipicephalus appendiculatus]